MGVVLKPMADVRKAMNFLHHSLDRVDGVIGAVVEHL